MNNEKPPVKLIKDVLGMNFEEYERYRSNVQKGLAMSKIQFIRVLALAVRYSPHKDAIRILHGWQRECSQAAMEYRIWEAKEKALKEDQPDQPNQN